MPQVSVIISVYNGEKTIQKTIDSVLSQTLSDFEIIIIDADFNDSTFKIVEDL